MKISYILIIIGLLGISCNKSTKSNNKASKKIVLAALENHNFDYSFYSSDAHIDIESPDLNIGVSAQFRIENEGAIWFVAKKFGFEVVRALIQNDTAKVIDRFKKRYAISSVSHLEKLGGLEDVLSYADDYMVGNIVIPKTKNKTVEIGKVTSSVKVEDGKSYLFVMDNTTHQLNEMSILENGKLLKISYLKYQEVEGKLLPIKYKITAFDGIQTLGLMFNHSNIELNTRKKMPFKIPNNYSPFKI